MYPTGKFSSYPTGKFSSCRPEVGRRNNVALIVLDPETAQAFARENGLGDLVLETLAEHPVLQEEIARRVDEANEQMSRLEQ